MSNSTTISSTDTDEVDLLISEAAAYAGVHPKTLRRWEADDILHPERNELNQRVYSTSMLDTAIELKKQQKVANKSTHFYRISEVSDSLQVSTKTIRRWHAAGAISCTRNTLNQRLFSEADLKQAKLYKQQLDASKNATMPVELLYERSSNSASHPQSKVYPPIHVRVAVAVFGLSSIPLAFAAYKALHTELTSTSGFLDLMYAAPTSMLSPLATNHLGSSYPDVEASPESTAFGSPAIQSVGISHLPIDDELPLEHELLTTSGPLDTTPPIDSDTVDVELIHSWQATPTLVHPSSPLQSIQISTYSLLVHSEDEVLPDIGLVSERIQTVILSPEADRYHKGLIVCFTSTDTVAPCNNTDVPMIAGVLLEVQKDALMPHLSIGRVLTMGLYTFDAMGLYHNGTMVTVDNDGSISPLTHAGHALGKVVRVVHGDEGSEVTVAVDPGWHDPDMVITEDGSLSHI